MTGRTPIPIVIAVAMLWLIPGASDGLAKQPQSEACQPGHFYVPMGSQLIAGDSQVVDEIVVDGTSVSIRSGCAIAPGSIRARKRGTVVTARWKTCGALKKVRLRAVIESDTCNGMTGAIRSKRHQAVPFTANRVVPLVFHGQAVPWLDGTPVIDGSLSKPLICFPVGSITFVSFPPYEHDRGTHRHVRVL